jgi:hypothetical protein
MATAIEGRWWLDFTKHPPRDPSGNEFILSNGAVSIAKTGDPAGNYQVEPGALTITLPMPSIPGEGPWQMVAQVLLIDPTSVPDSLPGVIRAIGPDGGLIMSDTCNLVRRDADA